jgi:replication factor A1
MKISELKSGQGNVDIELTVKSVEEPKTINKYGKELRLTNAIVTDGESEIKLTLWNDEVDKVKTGQVIKISKGYVNEFNGEKQLTAGKFGKIEIKGGEDKKGNVTDEEDSDDLEDY